jgi:hypothetical protein
VVDVLTGLSLAPPQETICDNIAMQVGSALVALCYALRCVHITRARAGARQACARRETRLAFTCARKSSSTLLQLLARFRRVKVRIFTCSVYRL